MVNIAVLAFFVDFVGSSCLAQVGLLLQKMSHRDQEKLQQKRSNKLQQSGCENHVAVRNSQEAIASEIKDESSA